MAFNMSTRLQYILETKTQLDSSDAVTFASDAVTFAQDGHTDNSLLRPDLRASMITVWVDTSELQRTGIGEAEAARLHRALTDLAHQDLGSIEVCHLSIPVQRPATSQAANIVVL